MIKSGKKGLQLSHDMIIYPGAPLPPPKPSAPNPDYQQCPYCGRRFQDSAAERHIPFCKEQASRRPRNLRNDGQDKLNKRMQVIYCR